MRLLRRLSYANVAATLALFYALGGTAVAGANGNTTYDITDITMRIHYLG